jgi:hypothetical protein
MPEYLDLLLLLFYNKNCYSDFQNSLSHLRNLNNIEEMKRVGTKMRIAFFCIVDSFSRILAGRKTLAG